MNRWLEFFEGNERQLSMTRLVYFLAFWPASYFLVTQGSEGGLGLYLGAFVGGYVGGKFADAGAGKQGQGG